MRNILFFLITVFVFSSLYAQSFYFDFASGYDGWSGNFADYPVGRDSEYELEFEYTSLPPNIDSSQKALRISGINNSDDLFMYISKQITGLQPNTSYDLTINIEFASNAPTNCPGVGGPPGEAVVMKAGAVSFEPQRVISYEHGSQGGYYLINLDKGNQSIPGADMDTVGHVGISDTTTVFALKTNTNNTFPFRFKTNSSDSAWIVIGTDSGFEGTTTLFYNRITISFARVTAISDSKKQNDKLPTMPILYQNYPNPFNPSTTIEYALKEGVSVKIVIYNILGQEIKTLVDAKQTAGYKSVVWNGRDNFGNSIVSGFYICRITAADFVKTRKMIFIE